VRQPDLPCRPPQRVASDLHGEGGIFTQIKTRRATIPVFHIPLEKANPFQSARWQMGLGAVRHIAPSGSFGDGWSCASFEQFRLDRCKYVRVQVGRMAVAYRLFTPG
jgi:hypothetical protein